MYFVFPTPTLSKENRNKNFTPVCNTSLPVICLGETGLVLGIELMITGNDSHFGLMLCATNRCYGQL